MRHLVEVEDEIELADVAKEGVQHFNKEMDGLECEEFIIRDINTRAEEETSIPPVDDAV